MSSVANYVLDKLLKEGGFVDYLDILPTEMCTR